jgi:hypothetical protein
MTLDMVVIDKFATIHRVARPEFHILDGALRRFLLPCRHLVTDRPCN